MKTVIKTAAEVATNRISLSATLANIQAGITTTSALFIGHTPVLPVPPELIDLETEITAISGEVTNLATTHSADTIRDCRDRIDKVQSDIDNAEANMAPFALEYNRNVVRHTRELKERSDKLMTEALGNIIGRSVRRSVNAIVPTGAQTHLKRNWGKYVAAPIVAGGAFLAYQTLNNRSTGPREAQYQPANIQENTVAQNEYDRELKEVSVMSLVNAAKTIEANSQDPSRQAFDGLWNYLDELPDMADAKWGPGIKKHGHFNVRNTTTNEVTAHYDVGVFTEGDERVIRITYQMIYKDEADRISREQKTKSDYQTKTGKPWPSNWQIYWNRTLEFRNHERGNDTKLREIDETTGEKTAPISLKKGDFIAKIQQLPGFKAQ